MVIVETKVKLYKSIKKFRKIFLRIVIVLLFLATIGTVVLSLPSIQTKLAKMAMQTLNENYKTNIQIKQITASLFSWNATAKDICVIDYKKDTLFYIRRITTSVLNLHKIKNGNLQFSPIDIDGLDFKLITYEGEEDTNLDVFVARFDEARFEEANLKNVQPTSFLMTSKKINIQNGRFRLINQNLKKSHILDFKKLKAKTSDFQISGPNVDFNIDKLSFKASNGLKLESLKTAFCYTKKEMQFRTLELKTANSQIFGDIFFHYKRSDFADFFNTVKLRGSFTHSKISFRDINALYNEFNPNTLLKLDTKVTGTLNDLKASNFKGVLDNSVVKGDFRLNHLFNSKKKVKVFAGIENITTTYPFLIKFMPSILGKHLPNNLLKLGRFTARGNLEITEDEVTGNINAFTDIGSIRTYLTLSDIQNENNIKYTGFTSLINFNVGKFIDYKKLGKVSMDITTEGKSFLKKKLDTKITGKIFNLEWLGYVYKNFDFFGTAKDQIFDGTFSLRDPNLNLDFTGSVNILEKQKKILLETDINYANFHQLQMVKDTSSVFKGKLNMSVIGNTIDDFIGNIRVSKASYTNAQKTYFFDDFRINSSFKNDGKRTLKVNSQDIMDGKLEGDFRLEELSLLAQNTLGSIYANYTPHSISEGQILNFNFKLYNKIVEAVYPKIRLGRNTTLKGSIDGDKGIFKANFKSPIIEAFGNVFENISFELDNKNPFYNTYFQIKQIYNETYTVKNFDLINTKKRDTLFFRTEFVGGDKGEDIYNFNLYHTFNAQKKSIIGFKKSNILYQNTKWYLNENRNKKHKIVFNKKLDSIVFEEFILNHGLQKIKFQGNIIHATQKEFLLDFKEVALEKILPKMDSLKVEGIVDGGIHFFENKKNKLPKVDLTFKKINLNRFDIGDLILRATSDQTLSNYEVAMQLLHHKKEKVKIIGNLKWKNEQLEADLLASFKKFNIKPLNILGEDVITNIKGMVSGDIKITQEVLNPNLDGVLTLQNAGLKIPYLNVNYDFGSFSRVGVKEKSFLFSELNIFDSKFKTKALLSGSISYERFQEWILDLSIDSKGERFLILNTDLPKEEDPPLYGTAFVVGTGKIDGNTNALNIKIEADSGEGTFIQIPISDITAIGEHSFIKFVDKNRTITDIKPKKQNGYYGLSLVFDLDIKNNAEVEIIVNQKEGSKIRGRAEGLLWVNVDASGEMQMVGDLQVQEGIYNFKFRNFIDKVLKVRPGGSVSWDGNPYDAQLNMEAIYALNANPAPLLENSNSRRVYTEAIVRLEGSLKRPDIRFDIDFPRVSSTLKSELNYNLQDQDQKETQFFSLLAQGIFISNFGIAQEAITGNLIQTGTGILNQVLSNDGEYLDLGLSYEQGYRNPNTDVRTDNRVGFTITTQLDENVSINARVVVPVGGVSETILVGEVEVEVILNENRNLSLKIFNKENEIQQFIAERTEYTQGVGLSYQVDFDTFKQLVKKIFKNNKKNK